MADASSKGSKQDAEKLRKEILAAIQATDEELAKNERLRLQVDFFVSALYAGSRYKTLDEITEWLEGFRKSNKNVVERVGIKELEKWYVDPETGNIRHESGKFFSVEGVKVEMKGREVSSWYQPIINQPEVGILGIIVKKVDGVYYFLMQAKTEPGNIDGYQVSPTTQATYSNYMRVHGGKLPPFVELFLDRDKGKVKVIYEGKQSEEGARFWKKNNLNIIIEVGPGELEEIPPSFCWMTLHQLKALLRRDNVVNVCARTVLSCLP